MTEAKKAVAKKPAAKAAPAAKKETGTARPAKKAEVKAAPKTQAPARPAHAGPTLKVVQIASPLGRVHTQRATLIGLGLNKLHRARTLPDTPQVRGMINKVRHLVRVEGAKS